MSDYKQPTSACEPGRDRALRRVWSRPSLTRLRAGEAEIGANGAKPEGEFAFGS